MKSLEELQEIAKDSVKCYCGDSDYNDVLRAAKVGTYEAAYEIALFEISQRDKEILSLRAEINELRNQLKE